MDNFKSVNELLDYETGDDFIIQISRGINRITRKNNLHTYRFGGEEFVTIFNEQDKKEQEDIVDDILTAVNANRFLKSKEGKYKERAIEKLSEYNRQTNKIDELNYLKIEKQMCENFKQNLTTKEARNDPYLLECIKDTDEKLNNAYLSLLGERTREEKDTDTKILLIGYADKLIGNIPLTEQEQKQLDEYLRFHYDKSAEKYQTKKWLNDFNTNRGFSITGATINFKPEFLKGKSPINLIGIAGEELKRKKHCTKRYIVS